MVLHITPAERAALQLLANGITTTDRIAEHLGIRKNELEGHLIKLFAKMGVRTESEAVAAARRRGLLVLEGVPSHE